MQKKYDRGRGRYIINILLLSCNESFRGGRNFPGAKGKREREAISREMGERRERRDGEGISREVGERRERRKRQGISREMEERRQRREREDLVRNGR